MLTYAQQAALRFEDLILAHSDPPDYLYRNAAVTWGRLRLHLRCHNLYVCTSKASKLSTNTRLHLKCQHLYYCTRKACKLSSNADTCCLQVTATCCLHTNTAADTCCLQILTPAASKSLPPAACKYCR